MGFGSAAPVAILMLALLPLLIYILFRRRYRRQELGSMPILLRAYRRVRRSLRMKELILLALRTLAVLLFMFAVLKPFIEGLTDQGRTLTIVCIDRSLSMRARGDTRTRWEAATGFVSERLKKAGPDDRVSLLLFDTEVRNGIESALTPSEALDLLPALAPGFLGTSPNAPVEAALKLVEQALDDDFRPEVIYLSDFSLAQWSEAFAPSSPALEQLALLAERAGGIALVDCSLGSRSNCAVSALATSRSIFCSGLDVRMVSTLANFSAQGKDLAFSLDGNGTALMRSSVTVEAGATAEHAFNERPEVPGPREYSASIPADDLDEDNTRHYCAEVRDRIEVLLVDGRPGSDTFRTASGYLEKALRPSGLARLSPLVPTVVSLTELETEEVRFPDIVILADPPAITPETGQRLADFVAGGGALIVALGPSVRPAALREGLDFLPASPTVATSALEGEWFPVTGVNLPEPLEGLGGLWQSGMKRLKISSFVECEPVEGSTVLLSLGSSRPLLVERTVGRGRVMLWCSSLDAEWSNIAALPMFPPLVHELCYFAYEGSGTVLNIEVGESFSLPLSVADASRDAELRTPDGDIFAIRLDPTATSPTLNWGPAEKPGLYRVKLGSERIVSFAVNPPATESDLTPLTRAAAASLLKGVDHRWLLPEGTEAEMASTFADRFQRNLFLAALLLLLAEMVLASLFSAPSRSKAASVEEEVLNL